jgi:hypothetical protein
MNFNHQTFPWDTDTISIEDRDKRYISLSSEEALIEVYMSANEPETLRDEYSRATNILDAEYTQTLTILDDVIIAYEILHVEKQHQLKILLQKYKHLFFMEH